MPDTDPPERDGESYSLITPFLTDDPIFAAGVEFGMLFKDLRAGPESLTQYVLCENQDRICVMAQRLGYRVVRQEPWDEHWMLLELERVCPMPDTYKPRLIPGVHKIGDVFYRLEWSWGAWWIGVLYDRTRDPVITVDHNLWIGGPFVHLHCWWMTILPDWRE